MPLDTDEIVDSAQELILAADQAPFENGPNMFGVLVPLMTTRGERFDSLADDFPNRGRVWWMLSPSQRTDAVTPGSLWSGRLEHARHFESERPEKDKYQIDRRSVTPGTTGAWLEIIDFPGDLPPVEVILSEKGVPCPGLRSPGPHLLRGRDFVLGPLRAQAVTDSIVSFVATNAGSPKAWRAERNQFGKFVALQSFTFDVNEWYHDAPTETLEVHLAPSNAVEWLQSNGDELDVSSDAQIIKWALGLAGFTNKERTAFREALQRTASAETTDDERMKRFRKLCSGGAAIVEMGADVAEAVAKQDAFKELVKQHIPEIAQQHIGAEIERRKAEIEKEIAAAGRRLDRLREQVETAGKEFDEKKAKQESELAREHASWLEELRSREEEIAQRETDIQKREAETEKHISGVLEEYRDRADEVTKRILADAPILRGLGVFGDGKHRADSARKPQPLQLPAYLDEALEPGALSEQDFLSQLAEVADKRGFVFDEEDLQNFHICMKIGMWTILAGPSGQGKSSLPRLYAEALGGQPYRSIPVRPDWVDDRDIVGSFNSLSNRFEPASTGLVDQLIHAHADYERKRGGIYVVCLDEMNLARVEHYFSQFLSILEEPEDRRSIELFGRAVERADDPYRPYRVLALNPNFRFVGSVNVDETTHFFSPKVLDRAPVVTFEDPDLSTRPRERPKARELALTPVHLNDFRSWIHGPEEASEGVLDFLVDIDRRLRRMRSGLGYRLRDRVLSYVASAQGIFSEDSALDFALSHSIWPRLRVEHPEARRTLEELVGMIPSSRFPRAGTLLKKLTDAEGAYDFFQLL
jgi:hypothetical protein